MFSQNLRKIFVVLLCVILISGVAFVVYNKVADNKNISESKTQVIFSVASEDVLSIDVKNPSGKFSIERYKVKYIFPDGEEISDIEYRVYGNHDIALSQSRVRKLLSDFYQFHILEVAVEDYKEADLKKYGFDENSPLVNINTADESVYTFTLGGVSSDNKVRYVKLSGDKNIYTMNRLKEETFLRDFEFYRETVIQNIDVGTVLSVSVTDKGERKMGIRFRNENDQEVVTTEETTYVMILPYNEAVNEGKFSDFISEFYEIRAIDFVDDNAEDLSVYGLDSKNSIKVVIQDIDRNVHRITFGGADESGNIYTIYGNNKVVFTTNPNMYNVLKALNPLEFIEKHTNIFYMEDVENVTLTGTQKAYSLDINSKENRDYEINDQKAHERGFETIYQAIIGIMITEQAEEEKKEKEVLDITFTLKDGTKATSKFYEYNSNNYGVVTTDGIYGLVPNSLINNILEVLEIFDKKPHLAP